MKLLGPSAPSFFFILALVPPALATETATPVGVVEHNAARFVSDGTANCGDLCTELRVTTINTSGNKDNAVVARQLEDDRLTAREAASSRRAYATLLYSDFIHGTRALGQSLRESGTTADTVVLVTPDVGKDTRKKLSEDGWM